MLVDLADLWGEVEQENRPGTGVEALNWRHRAALTLEESEDRPGGRRVAGAGRRGPPAGKAYP